MRRLLFLTVAVLAVAVAAPSMASACNDVKYKITEKLAWKAIGSSLDQGSFESEEALEYSAPRAKALAFQARRILMTGAIPCSLRKKRQRTYLLGVATSLYKAYNAATIGQLELASRHLDAASAYVDLLQEAGFDTTL